LALAMPPRPTPMHVVAGIPMSSHGMPQMHRFGNPQLVPYVPHRMDGYCSIPQQPLYGYAGGTSASHVGAAPALPLPPTTVMYAAPAASTAHAQLPFGHAVLSSPPLAAAYGEPAVRSMLQHVPRHMQLHGAPLAAKHAAPRLDHDPPSAVVQQRWARQCEALSAAAAHAVPNDAEHAWGEPTNKRARAYAPHAPEGWGRGTGGNTGSEHSGEAPADCADDALAAEVLSKGFPRAKVEPPPTGLESLPPSPPELPPALKPASPTWRGYRGSQQLYRLAVLCLLTGAVRYTLYSSRVGFSSAARTGIVQAVVIALALYGCFPASCWQWRNGDHWALPESLRLADCRILCFLALLPPLASILSLSSLCLDSPDPGRARGGAAVELDWEQSGCTRLWREVGAQRMAAIDNFWLDIFVNYTLLGAVFSTLRLTPKRRLINHVVQQCINLLPATMVLLATHDNRWFTRVVCSQTAAMAVGGAVPLLLAASQAGGGLRKAAENLAPLSMYLLRRPRMPPTLFSICLSQAIGLGLQVEGAAGNRACLCPRRGCACPSARAPTRSPTATGSASGTSRPRPRACLRTAS